MTSTSHDEYQHVVGKGALAEFSASPSYGAIAEAPGCARGAVYDAICALEQVGVPSRVNRIKHVREYVPRPVRHAVTVPQRRVAGAGAASGLR